MEQLSNHRNRHQAKNQKPITKAETPIKIKYISSPMMVQANNASEFRAIVQELTGQNSTIDIHKEGEEGTHHATLTNHQASWVHSNHEASKADVITQNLDELTWFSEDPVHVSVFDKLLIDEDNLWNEVSESLYAF